MAKEVRFNCRITQRGEMLEAAISTYSEINNTSIVVAKKIINNIQEELQYGITPSRIDELRRILNPSGIGVAVGEVGKRKYVRKVDIKNIEVVDAEIVRPVPIVKNIYDLIVPIGTIVKTSPTNNNNDYEIIDVINKTTVVILKTGSSNKNSKTTYSLQSLNNAVLTGRWVVINPSDALLKQIKEYTNVVPFKNFKRNNCARNDENNQSIVANYVISIQHTSGFVHIPVTPGFTGNCQLSVIGSMSTLITVSTDFVAQLKQIYIVASRKLLLCDLQSTYFKKLKDKIGESAIVSSMPYTSSNGSNMFIVILNLSKL